MVLIREYNLTLAECGGTSTLARGATLAARWLHDHQLAITNGVGVSTPCGAVTTRGIFVFVPNLLRLLRYGTIYKAGIRTYTPRVR